MTEEETGIKMIKDNLAGAEGKVNLEIDTDLIVGIEVRK